MIDIETLGTGVNAVITSISAVQFDLATGETGKEFHWPVEMNGTGTIPTELMERPVPLARVTLEVTHPNMKTATTG